MGLEYIAGRVVAQLRKEVMGKHHQIETIIKRLQDECISIPNAYVIEKLRQILKEELWLSLEDKAILILNEIACNRYSSAAMMLARIPLPDRTVVTLRVQRLAGGAQFGTFDRVVKGLERQDDGV